MTSQLNVDTIVDKAGSGGTNVKVAKTSTYVSEGGNVTQNLTQAVAKSYVTYKTANPTGVLDNLSFNHSSLTDIGTGATALFITNPRAQATCPSSDSAGDGGGGYSTWMGNSEFTTTKYYCGMGNNNFANEDGNYHCLLTYGDLA